MLSTSKAQDVANVCAVITTCRVTHLSSDTSRTYEWWWTILLDTKAWGEFQREEMKANVTKPFTLT